MLEVNDITILWETDAKENINAIVCWYLLR